MNEVLQALLSDVTDNSKMVQNRPKIEAVAEALSDPNNSIKNDAVLQIGNKAIAMINNSSTLERAVSILTLIV